MIDSIIKEHFSHSKRTTMKKKSLSISSAKTVVPQSKGHHSKLVSLIGLTHPFFNTETQIEECGGEIAKILKNNKDLNDSFTQDLLEKEGKRILEKLTESIYETTKGEYIINSKKFLNINQHNDDYITQSRSPNKKTTYSNTHNNNNNKNNDINPHFHQHKSSKECFNSLIMNTTKETDSKASPYSSNMAFSPVQKNEHINLYTDFNKNHPLVNHHHSKKSNPHVKNPNDNKVDDENDVDIFSFVSKTSTKSKEKKPIRDFRPKLKTVSIKQKHKQHLKLSSINNKSTNISLIPMPNSKDIKTFFDSKMKKKHPTYNQGVVLSNNIINRNSNTNSSKNKKSYTKKITKQSDDGCFTKANSSNKLNSEITEDFIYSRLHTYNNRGLFEDYVNI